MKKILLLLIFISTVLFANSIIDINKKTITISLATNLKKAHIIASKLHKYDVYIYKTQTTKVPYFVIYVVNINKKELKKISKDIKKIFKSSYIASDKRTKTLATNNFDKNIFIQSYIEKTVAVNKVMIKKQHTKKIITKVEETVPQFDYKKKSILLGYFKTSTEANNVILNYNDNDLYWYKDSRDKEFCCSVYIVNINRDVYNDIFHKISLTNLDPQRVSSIMLKYFADDKSVETLFIPKQQ